MPGAVATWVVTTFFAVGATSAVTLMNFVYWATYIGTTLLITGGLSAISASLMPRPKMLRGQTQEWGGTVEPRQLVYGTVRKSGMNAIPPIVTGSEGDYLHQILVLAGHPVDDITDVWFNQTKITDATISAIVGNSTDGVVTNGTYDNVAWIRRYTGSQTSTDYILNAASPNWGPAHKGLGLSYLALQFKYDKTVYATTGKPEVSALVKGKRIYDPREDSTNGGSGSHRYTDTTTWAYSNNPALCLADYLMDADLGLGEDPTRIDWTTVAAAANICDEVVSVPTGTSPQATTQKRYTCNVVLDVTSRYEDNIEAICTAMLGHCYYTAGSWQVHAGAWTSSAFDLSEDDLVGGVSVQADIPRNNKFNAVRGQYYSEDRNYQPSEFQPRTNSSYETADGERIWREVDFRACTNEFEAQRNAMVILRRSRNKRTVTADFGMSAFKVKPFETGTLTIADIGWTSEPVRCVAWEFKPEGVVRLTLQEESSTDWSDPAISDYTYVSGVSTPASGSYTPPTPTSLTATAVTGGTLLQWTVPGSLPPGAYFEIWQHTAASPFSSASVLTTTYNSDHVVQLPTPVDYWYWITAVSGSGTRGTQYPSGDGVAGGYRWIDSGSGSTSQGQPIGVGGTASVGALSASTGAGGTLAVTVSPDPYYPSVPNGTIDVGTLTAVVSGGTPPYTYSWTESTANVSLLSPTSASTVVRSTGTDTARSLTAYCTVTDSASPQATATDSAYWYIEHGWL